MGARGPPRKRASYEGVILVQSLQNYFQRRVILGHAQNARTVVLLGKSDDDGDDAQFCSRSIFFTLFARGQQQCGGYQSAVATC